jgi:hypothetical protein
MLERWSRRIGIPLLVLLYLGCWALMSRQITNATDFDVFFLPSAKVALAGHPLDIYRVRYDVTYPNANGPLSILPLTLVAAVAKALGIINDFTLCRLFVAVVFAVFPLLLSREAVLSLDLLLKTPPRGLRRLLAYAVFALSPELWHSVLGYGHIEHPLMLFLVLAGVRSLMLRRLNRAGIFIGLALLTRSSAVLYLIPLTLLLLAERNWKNWKETLRFSGTALLTLALGLLPFALADRRDLVYSLLTFHGLLPVGGGSVWGLTLGTPLASLGNQHDSEFVLGASVILSVLLIWRPRMRLGSPEVYALLAVSGLCFPLFLKTLWPYYYLDAYMFLAVWWLAMAQEITDWSQRLVWFAGIVLPASAVLAGQLAEYGLDTNGEYWTESWTLVMTLVTIGMMSLILALLCYQGRPRPQSARSEAIPAWPSQMLVQYSGGGSSREHLPVTSDQDSQSRSDAARNNAIEKSDETRYYASFLAG